MKFQLDYVIHVTRIFRVVALVVFTGWSFDYDRNSNYRSCTWKHDRPRGNWLYFNKLWLGGGIHTIRSSDVHYNTTLALDGNWSTGRWEKGWTCMFRQTQIFYCNKYDHWGKASVGRKPTTQIGAKGTLEGDSDIEAGSHSYNHLVFDDLYNLQLYEQFAIILGQGPYAEHGSNRCNVRWSGVLHCSNWCSSRHVSWQGA